MRRAKGAVFLISFPIQSYFSPSPQPPSDTKGPLRRREEHGITNKCSEKASISVSVFIFLTWTTIYKSNNFCKNARTT